MAEFTIGVAALPGAVDDAGGEARSEEVRFGGVDVAAVPMQTPTVNIASEHVSELEQACDMMSSMGQKKSDESSVSMKKLESLVKYFRSSFKGNWSFLNLKTATPGQKKSYFMTVTYLAAILAIMIPSATTLMIPTVMRIVDGIWVESPVAVLLGVHAGKGSANYHVASEEPAYDRWLSLHTGTAFVWIVVVVHQFLTLLLAPRWPHLRAWHKGVGRFLAPPINCAMVVLAVVAVASNRSYGDYLAGAIGLTSASALVIFVNFMVAMWMAVKRQITVHKICMFHTIIWTLTAGFVRLWVSVIQLLWYNCYIGKMGVGIGSFLSQIIITLTIWRVGKKLDNMSSWVTTINLSVSIVWTIVFSFSVVVFTASGDGVSCMQR